MVLGLLIKTALVCGVFGFQLHRRSEAGTNSQAGCGTLSEIYKECALDKKDLLGGDLRGIKNVANAQICMGMCLNDARCKAFTWATWKTCYIKGSNYRPLSTCSFCISGKAECIKKPCPSCKKPIIPGGTVSPSTDTVADSESYTVTCDSGYTMEGSGTMTCTRGTLSPAPTCNKEKKEVVVCEIKDQVYTECGSACTATCDEPAPVCTLQCVKKCQCPTDAPILHENKCIARALCPVVPGPSCEKPSIPGGTVSPSTDTVADSESYTVTCDSGYTMEGSGTMTCTRGTLSPAPTCNASCKKPIIPGGTVSPSTDTVADSESYTVTCDSGYTMEGSGTMTCTKGTLSPAPTCSPEEAKLEITAKPKKDQVSCKANKKKCQLEYTVTAKEGDKDVKVGAKSVQVCKLVEGKTEGCKKVSCKSPNFCLKMKPSAGDAGQYVAVVELEGQRVVSDPVTLTVV